MRNFLKGELSEFKPLKLAWGDSVEWRDVVGVQEKYLNIEFTSYPKILTPARIHASSFGDKMSIYIPLCALLEKLMMMYKKYVDDVATWNMTAFQREKLENFRDFVLLVFWRLELSQGINLYHFSCVYHTLMSLTDSVNDIVAEEIERRRDCEGGESDVF